MARGGTNSDDQHCRGAQGQSFSPASIQGWSCCEDPLAKPPDFFSAVLAPRASKVHSTSAMFSFQANFLPGSPVDDFRLAFAARPPGQKIFPATPGVTRASSGNHFTNSFDSVSAFQTSSTGAAISISLSSRRSLFASSTRFVSVISEPRVKRSPATALHGEVTRGISMKLAWPGAW